MLAPSPARLAKFFAAQSAIPRGFAAPEPLDCRSDVRRSRFLLKKKSKPTPIPPDVDSQTLTSRGFGVPSYLKIMPMLPTGGASKPTPD
jgi:hypothetical protein